MSYYNEISTPEGKIRPHYAGVIDHWNSISHKKQRDLLNQSKRYYKGDYSQDPFPRILIEEEL